MTCCKPWTQYIKKETYYVPFTKIIADHSQLLVCPKICAKVENNVIEDQSAKWTLESGQSPASHTFNILNFMFQTRNFQLSNLVFSCIFVQNEIQRAYFGAENFCLTSSTKLFARPKDLHPYKVETITCIFI